MPRLVDTRSRLFENNQQGFLDVFIKSPSFKALSAGVYFPWYVKPQQLYRKENINCPSSPGLSRLPWRQGHPLASGVFVFGSCVCSVRPACSSGPDIWKNTFREFCDICHKNVHLNLKINSDSERLRSGWASRTNMALGGAQTSTKVQQSNIISPELVDNKNIQNLHHIVLASHLNLPDLFINIPIIPWEMCNNPGSVPFIWTWTRKVNELYSGSMNGNFIWTGWRRLAALQAAILVLKQEGFQSVFVHGGSESHWQWFPPDGLFVMLYIR